MQDAKRIECGNHACKKCLNKETDECYMCAHCREAIYCSTSCQTIDWVAHVAKCGNVIRVGKDLGIAVPYFYEDMLSEADLASIPATDPIFQSRAVYKTNPNQSMTSKDVPALVDAAAKGVATNYVIGANPKELGPGTFELVITLGGGARQYTYRVTGEMPKDMIFQGNDANPVAQALTKKISGRPLHRYETSYVFWPPVQNVWNQDMITSFDNDYRIELLVRPDGNPSQYQVAWLSGTFKIRGTGKGFLSRFARRVRDVFQRQLTLKFKGVSGLSTQTKNMHVYRQDDRYGNSVILTFLVAEGSSEAQLVDLEFIAAGVAVRQAFRQTKEQSAVPGTLLDLEPEEIPADLPPPPPVTESEFRCDPTNINEVIGLTMALDRYMAKTPTTSVRLTDAASHLKAYAHTLQESKGVPPKVIPNAVILAISSAVETLFNEAHQQ